MSRNHTASTRPRLISNGCCRINCYVKHNSAVWRLLCFHLIVAKLMLPENA